MMNIPQNEEDVNELGITPEEDLGGMDTNELRAALAFATNVSEQQYATENPMEPAMQQPMGGMPMEEEPEEAEEEAPALDEEQLAKLIEEQVSKALDKKMSGLKDELMDMLDDDETGEDKETS